MSWEQLRSILSTARKERATEDARGAVACWLCGEPLTIHNGERRCRFDGWTPTGAGNEPEAAD
jgi:hypothetical protein